MGKILEGPWGKEEKNPEIKLNWVFNTDKESITRATEAGDVFREKLLDIGWDDVTAWGVWFGFQEAVTNAFAHGNLKIQKISNTKDREPKSTGALVEEALARMSKEDVAKEIKVFVEMNKNKVTIKVRDEGAGFSFEEMKDPTSFVSLGEEPEANGRGIFLIKSSFNSWDCKKIVDENGKEWNEVTLIKENNL